ncbi:19897_t:CDS:2 [Racocetra fulgida]|uniref:19897_t:CDS:1 n=1 Tax=Racocetra fulgida TaxID=60492 RepID=A0A9N9BE75_9GLOM|nr:19897_t:CDS:2 [Racocetra fulgida]
MYYLGLESDISTISQSSSSSQPKQQANKTPAIDKPILETNQTSEIDKPNSNANNEENNYEIINEDNKQPYYNEINSEKANEEYDKSEKEETYKENEILSISEEDFREFLQGWAELLEEKQNTSLDKDINIDLDNVTHPALDKNAK